MNDKALAESKGMTTPELRAKRALAKSAADRIQLKRAREMKDRGCSNMTIAINLGISQSSVERLLKR